MKTKSPYTDPQEDELRADRIALRIIGVFGIAILLLAAFGYL